MFVNDIRCEGGYLTTSGVAACNMTTVDLSEDADVVVVAHPALLLGVYVSAVTSAHAALVKDSTVTKITLPASTAAGTNINCHGGYFSKNITIESDNSATGTLIIFWRTIAYSSSNSSSSSSFSSSSYSSSSSSESTGA